MIQIQYLASKLWSGSLMMMMIIITFDLKALCRSLYAFFLECVVCFCYLYYIIMMIISVWQRDTSCFHWYILLHIKLWNLLLFCYGWICRVVLHDNLLCCTVIFFFFSVSPHLPLRSLTLRVQTKGFLKSSIFLQQQILFTYDFWICWIVNHYFFSTWLWIQMNRVELSNPHFTHGFSTRYVLLFPCLFVFLSSLSLLKKCGRMETYHCLTCWLV